MSPEGRVSCLLMLAFTVQLIIVTVGLGTGQLDLWLAATLGGVSGLAIGVYLALVRRA